MKDQGETAVKDGELYKIDPAELNVKILVNAMTEAKRDRSYPHAKFLIDGFPRTITETEVFEALVGEPDSVLYFNAPQDVIVKRLDTAKTSDSDAIIKKLKAYEQEIKPVLAFYRLKGRVRDVNSGNDADTTWGQVKAA